MMNWEERNAKMNEQEARWAKRVLLPGAIVMALFAGMAACLGLQPVNLYIALAAILSGLGVAGLIQV